MHESARDSASVCGPAPRQSGSRSRGSEADGSRDPVATIVALRVVPGSRRGGLAWSLPRFMKGSQTVYRTGTVVGRGAGSPPGAARRAPPATVDLVIERQPVPRSRHSSAQSAFVLLVLDLGSRRRRRVLFSAASFGVELVFLALVDGVGAITSAVGGGVTEAECDDDDGNDPQGVNGEADQPENQCGAQDDQHHLAEACPLAEQERDPLGQPAPFGCLAGAACRLGGRCWECSLR